MRKNALGSAAVVWTLSAACAWAQPGVVPPGSVPQKSPPPLVIPPQPTTPPVYDSLVKRDPAGKVLRVTGILDALALQRNPLIDEAARQKLAPEVTEWTAEVNQVAVDNLDFVEAIEGGLLDGYDVNDLAKTRMIQQMNVQLSGAGPLAGRLQQRGMLPGQAAGIGMQISNEYIQALFNELNSPPGAAAATQEQMAQRAAEVNRFFTALSSRDACEQYRRILLDSAPLADQVLAQMPATAKDKATPGLAAVKAATTDQAKMIAVRDMLKPLSFDDRRAFLQKAVSLGAAPDPYHPAPELPHKGGAS